MSKKDGFNLNLAPISSLIGLGAIYYFFLRPKLSRWGTLPTEAEQQLPGDQLILYPHSQINRAVTIAAAPEAVYPWLAQMGREGSGYYGLDRASSAHALRHDLPPLKVGMLLDDGLKVLQCEAPRLLVLGSFNRRHTLGGMYDLTCTYTLHEVRPRQTRLLVRLRLYTPGINGLAYCLAREINEFVHLSLQLNTLSGLAEATQHIASTYPEKSNGNLNLGVKG